MFILFILAHEAEVFEDLGMILAFLGVIFVIIEFKHLRSWYDYSAEQVYQHEVQIYDDERQKRAIEEFLNSE